VGDLMVSYSSGYWQQLYLFPPLLLAGEREREEMSNESSDVPYILVPPSFEKSPSMFQNMSFITKSNN
jgi:hypothetical protein